MYKTKTAQLGGVTLPPQIHNFTTLHQQEQTQEVTGEMERNVAQQKMPCLHDAAP